MIDVHHADRELQAGFLHRSLSVRKGIRQPQNLLILHLLVPIIKHYAAGRRESDQRAPVNLLASEPNIGFEFRSNIEQETQRKVGTDGTLMLIEIQCSHQNKRHVILHGHVQHIVQGDNLQGVLILIIRAVQHIVKLKQGFSVLSENIAEKPVFHLSIAGKIPQKAP